MTSYETPYWITDGLAVRERLNTAGIERDLCWVIPLDWPDAWQWTLLYGIQIRKGDVLRPQLAIELQQEAPDE